MSHGVTPGRTTRAQLVDPQQAHAALPPEHRLFRTQGWFARQQPSYIPPTYVQATVPDVDLDDVEVPQ